MRLILILFGLIFNTIPINWAEMLLDPSLVCKKTRKLRGKLADICRNGFSSTSPSSSSPTTISPSIFSTSVLPLPSSSSSSNLLKEIINGINLGFKECEFQFNNRRWNCTTLRKSMRKILMKDTRETSFVNAITSAGITYSVARACATGKLIECSCDRSYLKNKKSKNEQSIINENNNIHETTKNYRNLTNKHILLESEIYSNDRHSKRSNHENKFDTLTKTINNEKEWEWGGCGDNYKFGIRISKVFLNSKHRKRSDIHTLIKFHNNHAGRLVIRDNMKIDCKCHGLSGSCTVKTCWTKMPTFNEIGSKLKERFNGAVKVIASNDGDNFIPDDPTVKKPSKYDLVYMEDSPDFCRPNSKTGSLGTIGRQCNSTSLGLDSCEILCCNRGYYMRTIIEEHNCKCVFKWCCEVSCSKCKEKKQISICR